MKPLSHLILGIIFASTLLIIFPAIGFTGFFIIVISSVFIDVDHYIYYVFKKGDLNLKNAYVWFVENEKKFRSLPLRKKRQICPPLCFLHTLEFLLIFAVLSFYFDIFLFIFTGFIFHLFLDSILAAYHGYGHDISAVYNQIKSRKMKHIEDI